MFNSPSQSPPKFKEWEIYILPPPEVTNLTRNMPPHLDHLEIVASYNEGIKEDHTAAHSTIRMQLRDPQDFITSLERAICERTEAGTTRSGRICYPYGAHNIYEMTETAIATTKDTLRKAEESFTVQSERFGHLFAASDLQQQYPPATPPVSFDWALIFGASQVTEYHPTVEKLFIYIYRRSTGFTMDGHISR